VKLFDLESGQHTVVLWENDHDPNTDNASKYNQNRRAGDVAISNQGVYVWYDDMTKAIVDSGGAFPSQIPGWVARFSFDTVPSTSQTDPPPAPNTFRNHRAWNDGHVMITPKALYTYSTDPQQYIVPLVANARDPLTPEANRAAFPPADGGANIGDVILALDTRHIWQVRNVPPPAWDQTKAYADNDLVTYNGQTYRLDLTAGKPAGSPWDPSPTIWVPDTNPQWVDTGVVAPTEGWEKRVEFARHEPIYAGPKDLPSGDPNDLTNAEPWLTARLAGDVKDDDRLITDSAVWEHETDPAMLALVAEPKATQLGQGLVGNASGHLGSRGDFGFRFARAFTQGDVVIMEHENNRAWVYDGGNWVDTGNDYPTAGWVKQFDFAGGGGSHAFMGPKDLPTGDPNQDPTLATGTGYQQGDHLVTDKAVWFWNTDVKIAAFYGEPGVQQFGNGGSGTAADTTALNAIPVMLTGDLVVTLDDGVAHVYDGTQWVAGGTYTVPAWAKEFDFASGGGSTTETVVYADALHGLPASLEPNAAGSEYQRGQHKGTTLSVGTFMVTPKAVWQLAGDMNDWLHFQTGVDPETEDYKSDAVMNPHGFKGMTITPKRYIGHFMNTADMLADPGFTTAGDWALLDFNSNPPQTLHVQVYAGPAYGPASNGSNWDGIQTLAPAAMHDFPWDPNLGAQPVPSWVKLFDFDLGHATVNTITATGFTPTDITITNPKEGDLAFNTVDKLWWVYGMDPAHPGQMIWLQGGGGSGHTFAGPKDLPTGDPNLDPKYATGTGFAQGEHLVTDRAVWFWNKSFAATATQPGSNAIAALYAEPGATSFGHHNSLTGSPRNAVADFDPSVTGRHGTAVGQLLISKDTNDAFVWDGTAWVKGGNYPPTANSWVKEFDLKSAEHPFMGPKDLASGDPNRDPNLATGAGFSQGDHLVTDKSVWFWNVGSPQTAALYGERTATQLGGVADSGVAADTTALNALVGMAPGDLVVTLDDNVAHVWDGAAWVAGGTYTASGWVKEFDLSGGTVYASDQVGDDPITARPAIVPNVGDVFANTADHVAWVYGIPDYPQTQTPTWIQLGALRPVVTYYTASGITPFTNPPIRPDGNPPAEGDTAFNRLDGLTWLFKSDGSGGGSWHLISQPPMVTVSTTPGDDPATAGPVNPLRGDVYINSADATSWVFGPGGTWVPSTPATGSVFVSDTALEVPVATTPTPPAGETVWTPPAGTVLEEGDRYVNRTDHRNWVYGPDPSAAGALAWIPLPADNSASVTVTPGEVPENPTGAESQYVFGRPPRIGDLFYNVPDQRLFIRAQNPAGAGDIWQEVASGGGGGNFGGLIGTAASHNDNRYAWADFFGGQTVIDGQVTMEWHEAGQTAAVDHIEVGKAYDVVVNWGRAGTNASFQFTAPSLPDQGNGLGAGIFDFRKADGTRFTTPVLTAADIPIRWGYWADLFAGETETGTVGATGVVGAPGSQRMAPGSNTVQDGQFLRIDTLPADGRIPAKVLGIGGQQAAIGDMILMHRTGTAQTPRLELVRRDVPTPTRPKVTIDNSFGGRPL
jgi:hypothetical protein